MTKIRMKHIYWKLRACLKVYVQAMRQTVTILRGYKSRPGETLAVDPVVPNLNWRMRYARILNANRDLFDPAASVLEPGSGNFGIATFLKRKVTGLEPEFGQVISEFLQPSRGSVLDIPHPDRSFDIVICVDMMEHLQAADRPQAIREMLRVGRRKVLISCPCGPIAQEGEEHLAQTLVHLGLSVPDWLEEHLQNGLPQLGDLIAPIHEAGHCFTVEVNESMNQHFGGILLETLHPFARKLNGRQDGKTPFEPPFAPAAFDYAYSYLITVDLQARAAPAPLRQRGAAAGAAPVQLFSVCHLPWETSHLGKITPIFSGSAAEQAPEGALTDITTKVPRLQNTRWSELSAYFRVWQEGPQSAIIGFSHYRRLFDFGTATAGHARPDQRETTITTDELPGHAHRLYDAALIEALDDNTILLPPPIELAETVWEHYHRRHTIGDYCRVVGRLSVKYPHLLVELPAQFEENLLYANNMFIMRWQLFDEICGIWFDLLGEMAAELPNNRANDYQNRDVSFMAERIFDLWIRHKRREGLRLIETPILFIEPPKA